MHIGEHERGGVHLVEHGRGGGRGGVHLEKHGVEVRGVGGIKMEFILMLRVFLTFYLKVK